MLLHGALCSHSMGIRVHTSRLVAAVFLSLSFMSTGIRAQETPPDGRITRNSHWYGWQLLIADGAALALAAPGAIRLATDPKFAKNGIGGAFGVGLGLGLAVALIVPPALHLTNDHVGRAVGSAAARVLVPLATAGLTGLAGQFSCGDNDPVCHDDAAMNSARWVTGAFILVQAVDALNAFDERVQVDLLSGGRSLRLAVAF